MRVAFWHFYTFRLLRGIETLVISLSNALVRRDVDVSIVGAKSAGSTLVRPDPRVNLYTYPVPRYYAHSSILPFYLGHFLRHSYDQVVVFFADFGEGAAWRLLHRFRRIPLILYLCYPASTVGHRYRSFLRLGWNRHAKHVLGDSSWVAKEAQEILQREVHVVPVGTDPQQFKPDLKQRAMLRRAYGFGNGEVVLLTVAALERAKGIARAIQAVDALRDRFPQLRYMILGAGSEENALRAQVRERRLETKVVFGGTTTNLAAFYNMSDIFLMLPDAEANSIACHEAMSSSLPMVVSKTGGFPESVGEGSGFLVDPTDDTKVTEALAQLASNEALRRSMGESGRSQILAHYTWDRVADRYLEVVQ